MKRYFWVTLLYPLMLLILMVIIYSRSLIAVKGELDEYCAEVISNYCSDAATLELLETSNLDLDYTNMENISIDPEIAVHEFGVNLALNLGYQPTDDMVDSVLRDYIKILMVCGYDGYYVYEVDDTSNKAYNLIGSPKMPYTYVAGTDDYYALSLNGGKCWRFHIADDTPYLKDEVDCPISDKRLVNSIINSRLSADMNERIQTLYEHGWSQRVYIPAEVSNISKVNPVQGPTVLALMDSVKGETSFGVGGTRLNRTHTVAGYKRDGIKYYAYSDLLSSSQVVEKTFNSIDEAAKAGYIYDLNIMK